MLKRLWEWITIKPKSFEDKMYDKMWHEMNQESIQRGSELAQQVEDNNKISENLRMAGFDKNLSP